jgi:hypothetical protein
VTTNIGALERNSSLAAKDVGVLILAYQRDLSLIEILEKCKEYGFTRIYVAVDFPRDQISSNLKKTDSIMKILKRFESDFSGQVFYKIASENLGCGLSVLSGCDWLFRKEEFGIIIEDDCIPSNDFFKFVTDNLRMINLNTEFAVLCGTQFYKGDDSVSTMYKLSYPIFWGWATTRQQWEITKKQLNSLLAGVPLALKGFSFYEKVYWRAGCRRVSEGFVDTWDTLLTSIFLNEKRHALAPNQSLVQNIGNDEVATHTSGGTSLHNLELGRYEATPVYIIEVGKHIDKWMREEIYRISWRHLVSTKLTKYLDRIFRSRVKVTPLSERYISA